MPAGRLISIAVVVLALHAPLHSHADVPASLGLEDVAEVRALQFRAVVLERRGSERHPISHLSRPDFKLRLDDTSIDASDPRITMREIENEKPRYILVVDLNYLDHAARARVADAIEEFAPIVAERTGGLKIYALTRQIRLLTQGFETRPSELMETANVIRALLGEAKLGSSIAASRRSQASDLDATAGAAGLSSTVSTKTQKAAAEMINANVARIEKRYTDLACPG